MKRILSTITSLLIAAYWIGALALHLWTVALGFYIGGLLGAIGAFMAPVFSELLIIWYVTSRVGLLNWYNVACAAEIGLFIASIAFGILSAEDDEQSADSIHEGDQHGI